MEKIGAYTERATESGEWRSGNPATGQQATPMLASYFNMVQRELVAVVEEAGIERNKEDDGQLLQAIQALIAASALDTLNTVRANVASAATINLTTSVPNTRHINITGTTNINAFTVAAGRCYFVRFAGALTLANGAAIVTQTGADIIAAPGDTCILRATADNVVEVLCYASASSNVGMVGHFARSSAPNGWLKANGAAVSRTAYTALFAAIGTTFGSGDGSTTFNLPDLRGEFVRGWDDGRDMDSGRVFGSAQLDDFKSHTHTFQKSSSSNNTAGSFVTTANNGSVTVTTTGTGGTETRPRNVALLACIKY